MANVIAIDVEELRTILTEEVQKLRTEQSTAGKLSAISNAMGKILSSAKGQMEYGKMHGTVPDIPFYKLRPLKRLATIPKEQKKAKK